MGGLSARFPTTAWSVVLVLPENSDSKRRALSELARTYWRPLYFFARRRGMSVEEAKDAVQGFLLFLMEKGTLDRLSPERGRLRGFLQSAFANFVTNEWHREHTLRKGRDELIEGLSVDAAEADLASAAETPEAALDREWGLGILESSLEELRGEFESGRRGGEDVSFEVLERFFGDSPPTYEEASEEARISLPRLKSLLFRTRARYRELVRSRIQSTVRSAEEEHDELAELLEALRR